MQVCHRSDGTWLTASGKEQHAWDVLKTPWSIIKARITALRGDSSSRGNRYFDTWNRHQTNIHLSSQAPPPKFTELRFEDDTNKTQFPHPVIGWTTPPFFWSAVWCCVVHLGPNYVLCFALCWLCTSTGFFSARTQLATQLADHEQTFAGFNKICIRFQPTTAPLKVIETNVCFILAANREQRETESLYRSNMMDMLQWKAVTLMVFLYNCEYLISGLSGLIG